MSSPSTTPLRLRAMQGADGLLLHSAVEWTYSDGTEDELAAVLAQATDLSSASDELAAVTGPWGVRYHLSSSRSNVLRPIPIGPETRVLEIGAGCGAITRYLGERAGLVDALEPMSARARVARLRTRDLPTVEVHVGTIEDLPREATYDLVCVVGVLEYVGAPHPNASAATAFLGRAAATLMPGGVLALAIENRLGVKYLAGAPEDHVGRPFEGIEDYPHQPGARTYTRRELSAILAEAGLHPRFWSVFPDYKLASSVLADAAFERLPDLAVDLPAMPSPDWTAERPRLADERRLWRSLAVEGHGGDFANSFLVVAAPSASTGADAGESEALLPADDILAWSFATNRRSTLATFTTFTADPSGATFVRRERRDGSAGVREFDGFVHVCEGWRFETGRLLVDVLEAADASEMCDLLTAWRELVAGSRNAIHGAPLDLVPHNVLVTPAGSLQAIDQEWFSPSYASDTVVRRGLLLLGRLLAERSVADRWPDALSVRDVVEIVAESAGQDDHGEWLGTAVAEESWFQGVVRGGPPGSSAFERVRTEARVELESILDRPLHALPLGQRQHEELGLAREEIRALRTSLRNLHERRPATRALLAVARAVAPAGSRRRRTVKRILRRTPR